VLERKFHLAEGETRQRCLRLKIEYFQICLVSARELVLKEISSLVNRTLFEPEPSHDLAPEPVITLPAPTLSGDAGEAGGFAKPKKPGQRAPTVNTIQDRQEKEKQSQDQKLQQQQSPQKIFRTTITRTKFTTTKKITSWRSSCDGWFWFSFLWS